METIATEGFEFYGTKISISNSHLPRVDETFPREDRSILDMRLRLLLDQFREITHLL